MYVGIKTIFRKINLIKQFNLKLYIKEHKLYGFLKNKLFMRKMKLELNLIKNPTSDFEKPKG